MEFKSIHMMKQNRRPIVRSKKSQVLKKTLHIKLTKSLEGGCPEKFLRKNMKESLLHQLEKNALLLKVVMMNLMSILTYLATSLPYVGMTLVGKKIWKQRKKYLRMMLKDLEYYALFFSSLDSHENLEE